MKALLLTIPGLLRQLAEKKFRFRSASKLWIWGLWAPGLLHAFRGDSALEHFSHECRLSLEWFAEKATASLLRLFSGKASLQLVPECSLSVVGSVLLEIQRERHHIHCLPTLANFDLRVSCTLWKPRPCLRRTQNPSQVEWLFRLVNVIE